MKDPALLFYFQDWQGGTMTMSRFLKGCYMDLLCAQFNSGPLSIDEIKTVLGNDFAAWQGSLSKKFQQNADGRFFNERLETEKNKRKSYTKSRRDNLMGLHKENIDENVNDIEKRKEKFTETVNTFIPKYGLKTVHDFCNYWTERSEGARKMKFEKQTSFEIEKRLITWKSNEVKFNGTTKGTTDQVPARYAVGEQNYDNKTF